MCNDPFDIPFYQSYSDEGIRPLIFRKKYLKGETMSDQFVIKTIDIMNVDSEGFFCYMSKRKAPGYRQKGEWLEERFKEGLTIKIIHEVGHRDVGFIEYIPAEYAWRALSAPGFLAIHCLWIVGKGKGKGYGNRLIEQCLLDAQKQEKKGVVMVTTDRVWLAKKKIFIRNGFEVVDAAPPSFQLLVKRFENGSEVCFPNDWDKRAEAFGTGLTVIRTPQCPYIENGTRDVVTYAQEKGIAAHVVELKSAAEVQTRAPSPYGVFSIVLDGRLFAYHYLLRRDFEKFLGVHTGSGA